MSDLQSALRELPDAARRALAHELVLALDGGAVGKTAGPGDASASEETRKTSEGTDTKAAFPAAPARDGPTASGDGQRGRTYGDTAALTEHLGPAEGPTAPEVSATGGESAALGGPTVLRREVPGFAGETEEETALRAGTVPAADRTRRLRELSEYFRQDSRRYDPGFTRY